MKRSTNNWIVFLGGSLLVTFSLMACSKGEGSDDGDSVTISGINPSNVTPGATINIIGENLDGASVTVDGISTPVTYNVSTSIVTTVPVGISTGVKQVKVTNARGSATANITVGADPVIISIAPANVLKGNTITITGTGLSSAVVEIATKVSVINSNTATSIVAVVPTNVALGAASVRVTTSVGTTVSNVNIIE